VWLVNKNDRRKNFYHIVKQCWVVFSVTEHSQAIADIDDKHLAVKGGLKVIARLDVGGSSNDGHEGPPLGALAKELRVQLFPVLNHLGGA